MKKRKIEWARPLIGGVVLAGIIFLVVYSWRIEKRDIEENKMSAVGMVIRNYRIKSRGDFIEYGFIFEGIDYRGHQPVNNQIQKGECYLVEFSKKNPNQSRVVIEEKRKCT